MSDAQGNGAWLAADRDALRDKAAFGAPIGTEWRREERANRTATPLERTDAEGISGRDWMDRAKEAVDTFKWRQDEGERFIKGDPGEDAAERRADRMGDARGQPLDENFHEPSQAQTARAIPRGLTVERFRRDAEYAIADAWQHPEAAKAMRAAGASERGMQDDLSAGETAKVMEGLSAPDPAVLARASRAEPDGEMIANGWTRKEAEAMDAHIGAKYTREHPEPSEAATRQAERMADPTDRMHDARREREADAVQARRETVRQTAADYRAGLIATAPARSEAPALAETQTRRAVQRV